MRRDIETATDFVRHDSAVTQELLANRPHNLHRRIDDEGHERKELLHYIFDAVLPCIRSICDMHRRLLPQASVSLVANKQIRHFPPLPKKSNVIDRLASSLVAFSSAVHPAITRPYHRTQLIFAMHSLQNCTNTEITIPQGLRFAANNQVTLSMIFKYTVHLL